MCVCACVCVCERARVRVHARVLFSAWVGMEVSGAVGSCHAVVRLGVTNTQWPTHTSCGCQSLEDPTQTLWDRLHPLSLATPSPIPHSALPNLGLGFKAFVSASEASIRCDLRCVRGVFPIRVPEPHFCFAVCCCYLGRGGRGLKG